MDKAKLRVVLNGGIERLGFRYYEPGSVMTGSVEVELQKALECRSLKVAVQYHTEGRGEKDTVIVTESVCYQGQMSATSAHYPFELRLPAQPWSYTGKLINIVWEVVATLDAAQLSHPAAKQPFVMVPSELLGSMDTAHTDYLARP